MHEYDLTSVRDCIVCDGERPQSCSFVSSSAGKAASHPLSTLLSVLADASENAACMSAVMATVGLVSERK